MLTTLIDYYGFPDDAPGMADRPIGSPYARVEHVESALADAVDSRRFLPHLVLHEIEAWVLTDCSRLADLLGNSSEAARLAQMVAAESGPELVNDGVDTAPSKRIKGIYPKYGKTLYGPLVIADIGLDEIRRQCPHANRWLSAIETVLKPVTEIQPTTEGQNSAQLPSEFCTVIPGWQLQLMIKRGGGRIFQPVAQTLIKALAPEHLGLLGSSRNPKIWVESIPAPFMRQVVYASAPRSRRPLMPRREFRAVSVLTDRVHPNLIACRVWLGDHPGQVVVVHLVEVDAVRSPARGASRDEYGLHGHDLVVVRERSPGWRSDAGGAAEMAGALIAEAESGSGIRWRLGPGRRRTIGVVAPCIGPDGDGGGIRGDQAREDSRRACPAPPVPARLHAGRIRPFAVPVASSAYGACDSTPDSAGTTADTRTSSAHICFTSPVHVHGGAAIDLRIARVQDSGTQFVAG